jgi:hypothetical protein
MAIRQPQQRPLACGRKRMRRASLRHHGERTGRLTLYCSVAFSSIAISFRGPFGGLALTNGRMGCMLTARHRQINVTELNTQFI